MKKVYLFLLLCVCIQLSWGQDRATEIRNTFLSGNTSQLLVVAHRADSVSYTHLTLPTNSRV